MTNELLGALIGLAKSTENTPSTESTLEAILDGLIMLREIDTNEVEWDEEGLSEMIERIHNEKYKLVPDCATCASPCGNTSDYDANLFWESDKENQKLNLEIIDGLKLLAVCVKEKREAGIVDEEINSFFYRALAITSFDWSVEALRELKVQEDDMVEHLSNLTFSN